MRPEFFKQLYILMKKNPNVWALTGDLGYIGFDKIRDDFPDRFINCGASEVAMLGIAVGLALENKIVFVYTITSFFMRAAETIGLYLHGEQISIKLIGSGRNQDYHIDGPSHDATITQNYLKSLNIVNLYPNTKEEIPLLVKKMVENNKPTFIS